MTTHYTPLRCDPDHIPNQVQQIPRWMGTFLEEKPNGGLNKPPVCIRTLRKADKTNAKNWCSFKEARAALERGDVDAIGFVFTKDDPFTVFDFDDDLDPETGEISLDADEVVSATDSYSETSISGRGLHVIVEGKKPGVLCRKGNVELYDGNPGAKFVVITGNRFGEAKEIQPCQAIVNRLYSRWFAGEKKTLRSDNAKRVAHSLDTEDLLRRARSSRSGGKFTRLFDRGDVSGYKSQSDADFAMINTLIFWTAGDRDAIIELFKRSALYRPPPTKGRSYLATSVDNALSKYTGGYYQPKAIRESERREDVLTPFLRLLLDPSKWKGQRGASAYKAFGGLILLAAERGIETSSDNLHIGADVYTLAERAGVERKTLCRSALPELTKMGLITWRRGKGTNAGKFILRKPILVDSPKETYPAVNALGGSARTSVLPTLAQLIRMRGGRSKFAETARLGMVAMFCLVILTATRREQSVEELVRLTDRQKSHVWRALRTLLAARIVVSPRHGVFALAPDFWAAYDRELNTSGIIYSENNQRRRHDEHRERRAEDLRKRQRGEPVTDLYPSAKPRSEQKPKKAGRSGQVVRIASRYQGKDFAPREDTERRRRATEQALAHSRRIACKVEDAGHRIAEAMAATDARRERRGRERV
jgi:putative DNA primase/helicase